MDSNYSKSMFPEASKIPERAIKNWIIQVKKKQKTKSLTGKVVTAYYSIQDNQRWSLYFTSFKIQYKTNLYISLLTGFVYTIILHFTSLYTVFN